MLYIPSDPLAAYRPKHLSRGAAKTPLFHVSVNGENCPVRLTRESKMPFNRVWPGYQRDHAQTEQGEYVVFYGDGPVTVTVGREGGFADGQPVVRPLRSGVKPSAADGAVTLSLPEPGYFSLEFGSYHQSLQIFYCKPLSDDGGVSATVRFDAGVHYAGKMHVKSGDRIYVHPEAIVYGSVLGQDVENVTVYGGGILDDSTEERVYEDCYEPESSGCIRFFRSRGIRIRDVILLNASNWVLSTFDCSEVAVEGVKILGQWRYNTDGIDLVNAQHCTVRNCFVRSFDDTIVIKALYQCPVVEDITVEDCVLWCGWGKTLEIGLETSADEYRNIRFRHCDLIHNSGGAMTISNGNYAYVHDVVYEDIGIEYAAREEQEVYQGSDDTVYTPVYKTGHAYVLALTNWRMVEAYPYIDIAGDKAEQYGKFGEILYRNIRIFIENEDDTLSAAVVSCGADAGDVSLVFDNLVINGEKQDNLDRLHLTREGAVKTRIY